MLPDSNSMTFLDSMKHFGTLLDLLRQFETFCRQPLFFTTHDFSCWQAWRRPHEEIRVQAVPKVIQKKGQDVGPSLSVQAGPEADADLQDARNLSRPQSWTKVSQSLHTTDCLNSNTPRGQYYYVILCRKKYSAKHVQHVLNQLPEYYQNCHKWLKIKSVAQWSSSNRDLTKGTSLWSVKKYSA